MVYIMAAGQGGGMRQECSAKGELPALTSNLPNKELMQPIL